MRAKNMISRNLRRLAGMAIGTLAVLALLTAAQACNVPVFRFALERWRADPYRVVVFHRGPLTMVQRELLRPLFEQEAQSLANVAVRTVDAKELDDPADQELLAAQGEPEFPWLLLQYPEHLRNPAPIWAGPLAKEPLALLTDSPARRELVRRLAAGQTAVWVLLECGDAEKDTAAFALLEKELKSLAMNLKLPELTDSPADVLLTSSPLEIEFSLLRVRRDGEAEQPLVRMLIQSEPDLAERTEPMIFPVFGRGRAMLGLIGAGITAQNIHDSAAFLTGACSCEVKEQNPGFDLLLSADWDALLFKDGPPTSAVTRRAADPNAEPVLVPIPSGAKPLTVLRAVDTQAAPDGSSVFLIAGAVAAGTLLLVIAISAGTGKK